MSLRTDSIREQRKRRLKALVWLVLVVAVALFLRFGCQLTHWEIEGNTYYQNDTLQNWICEDSEDKLTWLVYLQLRFGETPVIPFVEEMEVELVDRHTLQVKIYEKEVIGCIFYMGEYVCFDKDGIMVGSVTERRKDVPIVTGLEYEKIVYNEQMDTAEADLFKVILNVTQLIRKHEIPVERIDFDFNREITLYVENVRVLLGKHDQYDEPLSVLPDILAESEGMKGVFNMKDYSQNNRKVVFVQEEE